MELSSDNTNVVILYPSIKISPSMFSSFNTCKRRVHLKDKY